MIKINDILNFLCERYPLESACDFDNVGLLVGSGNAEVDKALICLDCDMSAVSFAKSSGIHLIITHHPVIFGGIKTVLEGSVVYELIRNDISVISMHTNLDIADDGVTVELCKKADFKNIQKYMASDGFIIRSAECDFQNADCLASHLKTALGGAVRYADGGRPIKNVLVCSGSGGDFLGDAKCGSFDALVTADIKHNLFIEAANCGISLFDAGHYQTENIILEPLDRLLSEKFKGISFIPYSPKSIKSV